MTVHIYQPWRGKYQIEKVGSERSHGADPDSMIYSEPCTCGKGSLPWTLSKRGWKKSPFLSFPLLQK